jgi:predicted nucleic acid-binding protein
VIVVDASAWASALAGQGEVAEACREVLSTDRRWVAPGHAATEMLRTLRKLEYAGVLTPHDASVLAGEVAAADVVYAGPERSLITEQWELRHNVSAYDAAYVALCLRHGLPLVTLDLRLGRAAEALGVEVLTFRRD